MEKLIYQAIADAPHYHAFLGALIGGAVSLVGGLMGRSDAKKKDKAAAAAAAVPQVTTVDTKQTNTTKSSSSIDLSAMVANAEKAGFNPLSALRAGLGGAFAKSTVENVVTDKGTTTTTGHNAMAAVPTAPSLGSVITGAVSTGFDIFREDRQMQQAQNFKREQQEAYLKGVQSNNSPMSRSFFVPSTISSGSEMRDGGYAMLKGKGTPVAPTFETPTVTNPYAHSKVDPTSRDTAAAEDRYGDIFGGAFGAATFIDDIIYGVTGRTYTDRHNTTMQEWNAGTAALGAAVDSAKDYLSRAATAYATHSVPLSPAAKMKSGGW